MHTVDYLGKRVEMGSLAGLVVAVRVGGQICIDWGHYDGTGADEEWVSHHELAGLGIRLSPGKGAANDD